VRGVAINPNLPVGFFDDYDDYLGSRPDAHSMWWQSPIVRREFSPDGYAVYLLESMSKGEPTRIGFFETRDEAVENAMPYVLDSSNKCISLHV
jgi:hypothetical protein